MIFGISKNGEWKNVNTITEFLISTNYIDIINNHLEEYEFSELYEILPNEWLDAYRYDIFKEEFINQYTSKKNLYKTFERITSITGKIDENDYLTYTPDKFEVTKPFTKTFHDLFEEDFDYILNENVLYYSRSLGEDYWKNIQQFTFAENIIVFSKSNKKSKVDTTKETITTTELFSNYSYNPNETYFNFRGKINKISNNELEYSKLINIIKKKYTDIIIPQNSKNSNDNTYSLSISPMFSKISPNIKITNTNNIVTIVITNCSCPIEYDIIVKLISQLFDDYNDKYQQINKSTNQLKYLRSINPKLFVRNYTRESTILPIYVNENIDEKCIEFPEGSNQYYTAPLGYHIGLKKNRLDNNKEYPYIITCYKTDHINNSNTILYKYLNNIKIENKKIYDLFYIFEKLEKVREVNKCVILQDLPNIDPDKYEIKGIGEEYRYFEELYDINIIIIDKFENINISKNKQPYFWEYKEDRTTYIIKETKIKDNYSYEIAPNTHLKEIIRKKHNITRRSKHDHNTKNYISQHIDFNGKTRMIKTSKGWEKTLGFPLNLPMENAMNIHIKNIQDISEKFYEKLNLKKNENIYEHNKRNYYTHRYVAEDIQELF
jgi:hypothetical protein